MRSKIKQFAVVTSIITILSLNSACKKVEETTDDRHPVVATLEISEICPESALGGGNILSDANDKIITRGIVWDTIANPTIEKHFGKNEEGMWAGVFHSRLTSLQSEVTYFVRAYASNRNGISYGENASFTTLKPNTAADIEGNIYPTVKVGDQEWFASNLRVTRFSDGTSLSGELTWEEWRNFTIPGYRLYPHEQVNGIESDEEMKAAYGLLYNWYAAGNDRGLCPKAGGWRVATYEDWNNLNAFVIDNYNDKVAGRLKSCRQMNSPSGGDCDADRHPRWDHHDIHFGTDDVGFGALPAGLYDWTGVYIALGSYSSWWCADRNPQSGLKRYISIRHDLDDVLFSENYLSFGFSVRCVRDTQASNPKKQKN